MIVCPLCEHQQAGGAECEVCGRKLAEAGAAIPRVAPVPGLEPTGHAAVDAPPEHVPGLEPTGHAEAGEVHGATPDVDLGRAAPVDVEVAPVPGIERSGDAIPGDGPTALPALVACRYCRTPSMPGERICSRCGMRLPSFEASGPEAVVEARICSCGTPVRGSLCPSCGARSR